MIVLRRTALVALTFCASFAFTATAQVVCPPPSTVVVPKAPIGGNFAPGATPDFTWTAENLKGYTVTDYRAILEDLHGGPSTGICDGLLATGCVAKGLPTIPGTYSWHVEIAYRECPKDINKSPSSSFTVSCLDSAPVPLDPRDGSAGISTSTALVWSTVKGADHYDVYFGFFGKGGCTTKIGQTPDLKFDPGALKNGATYEWKVVAVSPIKECPVSPMVCATFTTASCPTSTQAAPIKPSAGDNFPLNAPITFSWTAANVPNVSGYDVLSGTPATILCSAAATATACTTTTGPPSAGVYDWSVRTNFFGTCPAIISANAQFTAGCATVAPSPVSPRDGETNVPLDVALQWTDDGAERYDLYFGVSGAGCTARPIGTAFGTKFSGGVLQPATTYEWRVVALSGTCPLQPMSCAKFTTAACPSDPAVPTDPASGTTITDSSVTFKWGTSKGALGYDLFTSLNGATPVLTASTTGESNTSASASLTPGTYDWFVRTRFATGCPPVDSKLLRFTVAASCKNAAPTLLAPAAGDTVALPVKFAWTGVDKATSYSVYGMSGTSTTPTLLGSTSATSLESSSLPGGGFEWFVRASFDNCPATESAHGKFTVKSDATCPKDVALLSLPKDGQTDLGNQTHFEWRGPVTASSYRLIASINGGTPAAIAETKDTQYDANLPSGSKVEWYVETEFDGCPPTQSQHFTFSTAATLTCPTNPGSATPIAPANGAASVLSPVTFQWKAVVGATGYNLIASVNNSSSAVLATTGAGVTQATVVVPQGNVVWVVETLFGDCPTTLSDKSAFVVTTPTECKNPPATLVAPANGATAISPVTYTWNAVKGALKYDLFAAANSDRFELLGVTDGNSLERITPSGTISWYVVTEFPGCPDQKSSTFQFKVTEAKTCGDGKIELRAPVEGGTTVSPTTLSWSSTGADSYRVWISMDGDAPSAVAKTTDTSITLKLSSGKIEWYVEGLFNNCPNSIISGYGHFIVSSGATCARNQPAVIVAPVGSISSTSVDFRWNLSAGANAYRVWVAPADQPFGDVGFTSDVHLKRELKPGKYEWFVESFFESCPTVESQHATFAIEIATPRCGDASPALIAPLDGTTVTDSSVTFLWSSVANATEYRLFVETGTSDFKLIGETKDTSLTVPLPPGPITWFVETTFDQCRSTDSPKARFTISRAANCDSKDLPRLVAPADGATKVASPTRFDWDAVSGGTRYVLYARLGEDGDTVLEETKDTFAQVNVPEGTVEWWVVAFRAACDPVESKHFRFSTVATQCTNHRPILQSPAEDSAGLLSPVHFSWTGVDQATGYKVFAEDDDSGVSPVATTTSTFADVQLPSGHIRWYVEAEFSGCPATISAASVFDVIKTAPPCRTPDAPVITVPGEVVTDTVYNVRFSPVANVNVFELEEATKPDFSDAVTKAVTELSVSFSHKAVDVPVQYLYRVRGVSSCSEDRGPYSNVIGIFIIPPAAKSNASAEIGTPTNVVQTIFLPGGSTPVAFTAKSDKPWVTITPSSGIVPTQGLTLVITADPDTLDLGTNTGTIIIEYADSGKNGAVNGSRTTSTSVSVSLVTPVAQKGKNTPLPESLIIPAVAHTPGANGSLFESDIRIANTSAQTMRYQVFFTPSGVDGTQTGSSTTVQVDPGVTMALDDIMASFFGGGNDGKGVTGMMEIRPLTTSTSSSSSLTTSGRGKTTVASSRTYNVTEKGTFGQYIPAIPYSQFISKSSTATKTLLSLQQISQSANYRTNFGLVEASGEPVSVLLSVFDDKNKKIGEIPVSLQASEHRQLNGLLATNGLSLEDGRIEVEVTSATGRVTAYASVVDNRTNDPLLVSPVLRNSEAKSSRFVLPSIGDFDIGVAHWKSDVRLFNAGTTPAALTLSYYPQGNPTAPSTLTTTLQPGEVRAFDNFVEANFNKHSTAGSLVVTSAVPSSIVATAKTYTASSAGTYGQFIPGVTPEQSIGAGADALQILQLEQSSRFRTNIGVTETSGKPAVAEISVIVPGAKSVPRIQISLAANEFRQISLLDFNLGTIYNTRATVKVMSGTGTVTAYGSLIDQVTQDPTYVPAQ